LSRIRPAQRKSLIFVVLMSLVALWCSPWISAEDTSKTSSFLSISTSAPDQHSAPSHSTSGVPDKYIAVSVAAMSLAGVLLLIFKLKQGNRRGR
jgi:hypothetical protein